MGGNESFFGRNIAERGGDEGMYPMMLKKKLSLALGAESYVTITWKVFLV